GVLALDKVRALGKGISVPIEFEWDPEKAVRNLGKHGVSFEEAASAFGDSRSLTIPDPEHSIGEDRSILLGMTAIGQLLVVVFVESGPAERIISARMANRRETRQYMDENE
ncbi:MAG: BrnT family toxin, partial [Planctomycetota bacterium]